jgi:hypothetical protein
MWRYSVESIKQVKNTFTTIGYLSELEFMEQSYVKSDPPLYEYSMLAEVKNKAMESEYAVAADIREYVMGYNENIMRMLSKVVKLRHILIVGLLLQEYAKVSNFNIPSITKLF